MQIGVALAVPGTLLSRVVLQISDQAIECFGPSTPVFIIVEDDNGRQMHYSVGKMSDLTG